MKYIVLCLIAAGVCLAAGLFLTSLLGRKRHFSRIVRVLLTVVFTLIFLIAVAAGYLSRYSHAGKEALAALSGSESVKVSETSTGWYFDGPGEKSALIFYPGAKVEAAAYAPLLLQLAESGEDAFLIRMPCNMAIFGMNRADSVMETYDYGSWYLAGHSMGGMTAALYTCSHPDAVDGLILLAAYSTKELPDEVRLCSIYGSEDGCLDRREYEQMEWPADFREVVIPGGNHAQFGDYGHQKGDGEALISAQEQQEAAVRAMTEMIEE